VNRKGLLCMLGLGTLAVSLPFVAERWAVIAYSHRLSGHAGPHVPSEHPELGHGPAPVAGGGAPARPREGDATEAGRIAPAGPPRSPR
jgi:hypothetical protein